MKICFIGHRKIENGEELRKKLYDAIEKIVEDKNEYEFLFGSKSEFDSACLQTVSKLKEKYPNIKRIYVRAEYPFINEDYLKYLLNFYDETLFPEELLKCGKCIYIKRNEIMINLCDTVIFYCKENSIEKSGALTALNYAKKKKNKNILNFF